MIKYLLLISTLSAISFSIHGSTSEWDIAESQIVRLSPDSFPKLPPIIKNDLKKNGCKIPQTYITKNPHNVISGSFKKHGQIDWAILCSINGTSTIRIYFNSKLNQLVEIGASKDLNWLQGIGGGKIGFSRFISTVGKDFIMEHYKNYGGTKPPAILHDGIDEAFTEKASEVLYYHKDSWVSLTGAD